MLKTHVGLRLGFRYWKYLGLLLNVSKHKLFQSYHPLRLKDLRMLIMIPHLSMLSLLQQLQQEFVILQILSPFQILRLIHKLRKGPMLILLELLHVLMVFYWPLSSLLSKKLIVLVYYEMSLF